MMHQVAWLRGKLATLIIPYLLTGIPSALFLLSCVAMIEMSHTEQDTLQYLWMELNPSTLLTWIIVAAIAVASLIAIRLSLPRLREAWESANAIPEKEDG